jgi:DNA-directed RNA polymerase specialized sigma24 family protein
MADPDGIWTGITREQFTRALESLPADFRAVFELRAGGQPYDQIAASLAISREAVGLRLGRARSMLAESLAPPRLS